MHPWWHAMRQEDKGIEGILPRFYAKNTLFVSGGLSRVVDYVQFVEESFCSLLSLEAGICIHTWIIWIRTLLFICIEISLDLLYIIDIWRWWGKHLLKFVSNQDGFPELSLFDNCSETSCTRVNCKYALAFLINLTTFVQDYRPYMLRFCDFPVGVPCNYV